MFREILVLKRKKNVTVHNSRHAVHLNVQISSLSLFPDNQNEGKPKVFSINKTDKRILVVRTNVHIITLAHVVMDQLFSLLVHHRSALHDRKNSNWAFWLDPFYVNGYVYIYLADNSILLWFFYFSFFLHSKLSSNHLRFIHSFILHFSFTLDTCILHCTHFCEKQLQNTWDHSTISGNFERTFSFSSLNQNWALITTIKYTECQYENDWFIKLVSQKIQIFLFIFKEQQQTDLC